MTKRTERRESTTTMRSQEDAATLTVLEQRVIAMAEQLGRIAGSAQAKTDGWLDEPKFKEQLARVRDGAADLLKSVSALVPGKQRTATRPKSKAPNGRSGGKVDAPGKKHRKAPEAARGVKHSDQRVTKAITAQRMKRGKARQG